MSLRRRLFVWYTSVFVCSAALLTVGFYVTISRKLRHDNEKYVLDQYYELRRMTLERLADLSALMDIMAAETAGTRHFVFVYRLRDAKEGTDVVSGPTRQWRKLVRSSPMPDPPAEGHAFSRIPVTDSGRALVCVVGRPDPEKRPSLVMLVGLYNKHLIKRLEQLRESLLYALLGCVLLAGAGGWILTVRSLRPFSELVRDLHRVQSSGASQRLPGDQGGDEVAAIRRAVNAMLDRIESAFARVKSFTGDAAHELRTPVASLRCRIDVALRENRTAEEYHQALLDVRGVVDRLNVILHNLMMLARMDATNRLPDRAEVSLAQVAAEVDGLFRPLAENKGVNLRLSVADDCTVSGNREMLRSLLGNLVDNAIRYTPPSGRVEVDIAPSDGRAVIRVRDTGIGMSSEAQERAFERFYRARGSRGQHRTGAGLGLSICARIVELHGGHITVESRRGCGTTFTAELPLAGASERPPSRHPPQSRRPHT